MGKQDKAKIVAMESTTLLTTEIIIITISEWLLDLHKQFLTAMITVISQELGLTFTRMAPLMLEIMNTAEYGVIL